MLSNIIWGLIMVVVGAVIVIKGNTIYDWFGSIDWADKYLGAGGSRLMYKFIGLLMCFIGFMVATGLWGPFIQATLVSWLHLEPAK